MALNYIPLRRITHAQAITTLLRVLFVALLIGRFLFPFFYNPIDCLISDMLRHLNNGYSLTQPGFYNAMDPKGYQLWVRMLLLFPDDQARAFDALFNGILCAGLPWCWYKAMREITTRNKAYIIAIILGLHVGYLAIYSFFLIETLLLTSVALSVWMTLRAIRKRTLSAFIAATLCWLIAGFTKQTALPIMVLALGYELNYQPQKIRVFIIAAALFALCVIAAGLHSIMALNIFAPFGIPTAQTIARKAEHTEFGFHAFAGPYNNNYGPWTPEAFLSNPLDPLSTYRTDRIHDTYIAEINVMNGPFGWAQALEEVEKNHTWDDTLNEYKENVLYLFFAYDDIWPHSPFPYPSYLVEPVFLLRWLWMPCFLVALGYGPFARMSPHKTWLLLVAFIMTWGFLLQDVAIVEGRYRKIIGPFLFSALFFMAEIWWQKEKEGRIPIHRFALNYYVYPVLRQFLAPLFPLREVKDAPVRAHDSPDDKAFLFRKIKKLIGMT